MTALVAVCGMAVAIGALLLVFGWVTPPPPAGTGRRPVGGGVGDLWVRLTRRPPGAAGVRRDRRWLLAVAAGLVVYAVTGWVAWLVIVPAVVVVLPAVLADPPTPTLDQLAALDRWIHGLAATLPTGQSVADAIRHSRRNAPALLHPHVEQVVVRMDQRWNLRDALGEMADSLRTPESDAVLAALSLAAHRGGSGATATLHALSDSIQHTLAALREIEAERAKPRIVVRQVTAITLVMLVVAMVFGNDFFAAYGSPLGQVILVALAGAYLGSLVAMRHITRPRPRARILQEVGA